MLERLSEKFAGKLIKAGIISEADADVYIYGFFQNTMMLLNVITTLLLGVLFKLLVPCILLNLAYIPIRINAGGHHASSPFKCYINSIIIIAVLLFIIKRGTIHTLISIAILAISSVIILILAPVETENNPLDESEKRVYRKRTIIILGIEIVAFIISLVLNKSLIAEIIALGLFTECLMLIMGYAKNHNLFRLKK
jgi:putative AIP processing-secretion protein